MPEIEDVVAQLVCALINDEPVREMKRELEAFHRRRQCPPAEEIVRQLRATLRRWDREELGVRRAEAVGKGLPGDIRLDRDLADAHWIEVKAQLTKPRFDDIVQSDWEQDFTAAMARLAQTDRGFSTRLTPEIRAALRGVPVAPDWTMGDLIAADVAGIPDADRARREGVRDAAGIRRLLRSSYLLHLTREGTRLYCLADLEAMRRYLAGQKIEWRVESQKKALASVKVAWGCAPGNRTTQVTYYLGYGRYRGGARANGRHKLNAVAIGDRPIALVRAR